MADSKRAESLQKTVTWLYAYENGPVLPWCENVLRMKEDDNYSYAENVIFTHYLYEGMTQVGSTTMFDLPDYVGHYKGGKAYKTITAKETFHNMLNVELDKRYAVPDAKHESKVLTSIQYAAFHTMRLHGQYNDFPHVEPGDGSIKEPDLDNPWNRTARKAGFSSYTDASVLMGFELWKKTPSLGQMFKDAGQMLKTGPHQGAYRARLGNFITAYKLVEQVSDDVKTIPVDYSDEHKAYVHRNHGMKI